MKFAFILGLKINRIMYFVLESQSSPQTVNSSLCCLCQVGIKIFCFCYTEGKYQGKKGSFLFKLILEINVKGNTI